MPGRHGRAANVPRIRVARLLPALLVAALLAACGGDDEQPARSAQADTQLRVEVTGAGAQQVSAQLTCGGTTPCDRSRLDKLARVLEPEDPAAACTLQYGGPERAHVTGTLEGEPVDVTVTRTNGCGIADYKTLFSALGRKPPLDG
jgi:hypothetical protein